MGNIGIQLGPPVGIADRAVVALPHPALVAVGGLEVILRAALVAVAGELAAGHGDERAVGAVDDLQVADDERSRRR